MADEDTTATLEQEVSAPESSWATMDAGARDAYLAGLREKIAADHDSSAVGLEDDRARDVNGRFTKPETTDTTAVPDETPGTGDSSGATKKGADDKTATDWLDQETRDLAAAYGIDDDDLAAMPSREVLAVAMRAIDKKAFAAAKAPAETGRTPEKPAQQPGQTAQDVDDALAKLEAFNLEDELGADDAPKIRDAFKAVTAELKALRDWRTAQQQTEGQRALRQLQSEALESLHSLGHAELFGKPGEEPTKEQAANIQKAIDAHFVHARGLIATGRQAAPTPPFLKAAVHSVFGDQIVNQTKQQQLAKLKAQSSRRTGGGTTKANAAAAGSTPYEKSLAALPQLRRALDLKTE